MAESSAEIPVTQTTNEQSKPGKVRRALRQIGAACTASEYKGFRRLTATYSVGTVLGALAFIDVQHAVGWFQANDSVVEDTISNAAHRATGTRLQIHCDTATKRDDLETRSTIVPNVLRLTQTSCDNLLALKSRDIRSDDLVATQNALRILAGASVMEGDILGAETTGEVRCVATQYFGALADNLGLDPGKAETLQLTEVARYDRPAPPGFEDVAIPNTCMLGGPLDARVSGAVLPPVNSIRW